MYITSSLVTLRSGTSGIAPIRSGKCVYTEGIVSAQRDVKPESLRISLICSHFDQHMCANQSRVPDGFDLIVRLCLHQERDCSSLIQFDRGCTCTCLVWSDSVWFGLRLHYEIHVIQTESNRFDPEH